jgi:mono/diheme cytochrome c family protein
MIHRLQGRLVALVLGAGTALILVASCGATPTPTPTLVPPTATRAPALPTATTVPTATKPPTAATATQPAAAPTTATAPTATQPAAAATATTAATATQPPAAPTVTTVPAAGTVSFAKDILPIFQKNCTRCHGGGSPRSGLSLESYDKAMKGGNFAPDIVAGNPDKSNVYTYVRDGVMPFGGQKLDAADIQKILDWIKGGALNN